MRPSLSRRQVAELPPIAVRVTEHRLHRVCCPECAAVTTAEPPAESRWAFGPRLQAAVVTLAVRNRVSRRDTTELARELFGVELSTGTVDAIVQRAGEALAAPHTRLEQEIKRSPVVNIDETGWKTARRAPDALGRAHRPNRGVPDRGRPSRLRGADAARRTLRRDRLLRPLARLRLPRPRPAVSSAGRTCSATSPPTAKAWANNKTSDTPASSSPTTCSTPGSSSSKTATGPSSKPGSRRSKTKLHAELEHASRKSPRTKYHRQFARNLLKRWPALWTFTHTDGVEPTNNHAERGLRGAVIYRKLSLGTQSERGERTIERLLSASITCRLRKQSLFAYLTEVITAHARGDPIPALS